MKHRSKNATRFALTGVALAASCLWGAQAWALGLGRLNVQSALGESLRAEIDVTNITPEEVSTLRLRIAPPEAYRAAGVEYNPVLPSAQVVLQQRADGRQVLRVTSDRAVLEPFIDVILEANWATGRLVREYTMLFDPPGARLAQAPAAPQTAPVVTPAPRPAPTPTQPPAPMAQAPAARPAPIPAPAPAPAPVARAAAPAPAPVAAPVARVAPAEAVDEITVRSGDSLSRIAARTLRPGVSLDQMLVSLFRGNPQAFMGENMNRLKAGAVLSVPTAEAAARIANADAREVIQAQSADFAAYRQRLAAGTTTVADSAPARQATGKVQANVEDRKAAAATTPDKLTLSQGGLTAAAPDAQASRETERKDATARLAELSRNVDELKKLQGATVPAAPAQPSEPATAATPAAPSAQPAPSVAPAVVATAPAAAPAVPALASASAPAAAPASAAARTPPVAAAPAAAEPGFLDSLLENPLVLPGAAVLVALIAGLGVYRLRGRMRKPGGETSFLESRLQPDSFFGASGGQRIDTRESSGAAAGTMSSMSYSLSQLDAIGDVDPVAEADVYLAYGRDLQAEEILKEAMRATPERMAIRTKLLEVYLKRRDVKGFELLATQLFSLTRGSGEDWDKAQELGRQIDPDNPLYRPGGAPDLAVGPGGKVIEPLGATTMPHTAKSPPPAFVPAAGATLDGGGLDVDLELDVGTAATSPAPSLGSAADDGGLDFDIPLSPPPAPRPTALDAPNTQPPHVDDARREMASLDFDLGDLPLPGAAGTAAPPAAGGALDFDDFGLGSSEAMAPPAMDGDPLSRKLELAEEFRQIGDLEGARDLLEEVIAKAEGVLKTRAQGMLAGLG